MAGASESTRKTTSMCTAACIAQAFLGLAARLGLGSILASDPNLHWSETTPSDWPAGMLFNMVDNRRAGSPKKVQLCGLLTGRIVISCALPH